MTIVDDNRELGKNHSGLQKVPTDELVRELMTREDIDSYRLEELTLESLRRTAQKILGKS